MLTRSPTLTQAQLAEVNDTQLERLALGWRAEALRGNRKAFGVAHALEVERRRRLRHSLLQTLEPLEPPPPTQAWWKFW